MRHGGRGEAPVARLSSLGVGYRRSASAESLILLVAGEIAGIVSLVFEVQAPSPSPHSVVSCVVWIVFLPTLLSRRLRLPVSVVAMGVVVWNAWVTGNQPWPLGVGACALLAAGVRRSRLLQSAMVLMSTIWMAGVWLRLPDMRLVVLGIILPVLVGAGVIGELWGRASARATAAEEAEARRVVETQSALAAERRRIAKQLHDGVARALTAIHVNASILEVAGDEQAARSREAIFTLSEQALVDLAGYVRVLDGGPIPVQPETEAPAAVALVLEEEVANLRSMGYEVEASIGIDDMPTEIGSVVVAFIREGVANIVKHSTPLSECRLDGRAGAGGVNLRVSSVVPQTPRELASSGMGLTLLERRFVGVGGRLAYGRQGEQWHLCGEIDPWPEREIDP